ncbi:MAG: hypothetical protein Q9216_001798 [Gyalolechia sp. 2 TL-2023]
MARLVLITALILTAVGLCSGVEYVVKPSDPKDKLACEMTGKLLEKACPGKVQTYFSQIRQVTQLWLIDTNPTEITKISSIPGVRFIEENIPITKNTLESAYVTDPEAILNLTDFVQQGYTGSIEWLWTPGVSQTKDDNDAIYHGSCVASKAAGWIHGVSKNSRLVVVKTSHSMADNEWAFAAAYDDIVRKGRVHSSVVLYARSSQVTYTLSSMLPEHWAGIRDLLFEMIDRDIMVVTSAGNEGVTNQYANTIPAIWGDVVPLFVVGAVTLVGQISSMSQRLSGVGSNIWAPGEKVKCASGLSGEQTVTGTSASAGMVAGLVVYLLKDFHEHGRIVTPTGMKDFISTLSRPIFTRKRGPQSSNPNVIYNGAPFLDQSLRLPTNSTVELQVS